MVQLLDDNPATSSEVVALTPSAAAKIRELISAQGEPDLALRVIAKAGGCQGFSYEMYFDAQVDQEDLVTVYDGVKVAVDPTSAEKLSGSTLEYNDELVDAGFSLKNPNQAQGGGGCGCKH